MGVSWYQLTSFPLCTAMYSQIMETPWFLKGSISSSWLLSAGMYWIYLQCWICCSLVCSLGLSLHHIIRRKIISLHSDGIIWLVVWLVLIGLQTVIPCRHTALKLHVSLPLLLLWMWHRHWSVIFPMLLMLTWGVLFMIVNVDHYFHPFCFNLLCNVFNFFWMEDYFITLLSFIFWKMLFRVLGLVGFIIYRKDPSNFEM